MNFKKRILSLNTLVVLALSFIFSSNVNAQVGISDTGIIVPNSSSVLEVRSTQKGLLTPRMTTAQKRAISSPASGLTVYQTDSTTGYYVYTGSTWERVGGGLINVRVLTSGTSYTPTAGTRAIMIEMVGGGGGGGAHKVAYNGGSGGGAGGYLKKYITGISSSSSYTYSIGSGGAGALSAATAAGSAGTSTTFQTLASSVPASTTFTAVGGSGGVSSTTSKAAINGGAGGTTSSSNVNLPDIAFTGVAGGTAYGRGSAEGGWSGAGGSTLFGSGGAAIGSSATTDVTGNAGSGYGAGGGGAYAGTATGVAGGAGAAGVIIIYEYN